MSAKVKVSTVDTRPFDGQKPGTSGLRKQTSVFMAPHYMENFIQCTLEGGAGDQLAGSTLVVGGDGRYGVKEAVLKIIQMAAANGVAKLIVGQDGILSTPAVSCLIRKLGTTGGIILTASHNPGGKDGDFGIKYNTANGGPAGTSVTDKIYSLSTALTEYKICPDIECDFSSAGTFVYDVAGCGFFTVQVRDSLQDYVDMMKDIFDFAEIQSYLRTTRVLFNSLHGVTGPYVERILRDELGAAEESFLKTNILEDFGGGHPDPNLTYASDLVSALEEDPGIGFGAAFDGDGDRNMILGGSGFFVTPCDSLAVIADNLHLIPYFRKRPATGYARSMPTSAALDRVARAKGVECFETPTGWKFFGNLLDADRICLCGEESFGTGSDHIREKDGIWAALAWLQILASKKVSVEDLLKQFWSKYGRNFFTRYDYENCASEPCRKMMEDLQTFVDDPATIGKEYNALGKTYRIKEADNFEYVDPIDASITTKQGIRILFSDGSRLVFRLSGTGSSGATVRLYVDSYEASEENQSKSAAEMLAPCVEVGLQISRLRELTGRDKPTVVT